MTRMTFRSITAIIVLASVFATVAPAAAAELVMFRRDGCPYCAAFDRVIGPVYPKTEIGKRIPLRQVDLDRSREGKVALKSPIRFTPTFVLVDSGVNWAASRAIREKISSGGCWRDYCSNIVCKLGTTFFHRCARYSWF